MHFDLILQADSKCTETFLKQEKKLGLAKEAKGIGKYGPCNYLNGSPLVTESDGKDALIGLSHHQDGYNSENQFYQ